MSAHQFVIMSCFAVTAVTGRGLSVIGGKGKGTVCVDCDPTEFDPDELTWALVTLTAVTACYLAVCFCRCYPKLKILWTEGPIPPSRVRHPHNLKAKFPTHNIQFTSAQNAPGSARPIHPDCNVKAVPGYPNRRRSSLNGSNRFVNRRLSGHRTDTPTQSPRKQVSMDVPQVTPNNHQTSKRVQTPKRVQSVNSVEECCEASQPMKRIVFDYPVDINGQLIPYPSGLIKPEVFSIKIPIDSALELLGAEAGNIRTSYSDEAEINDTEMKSIKVQIVSGI